MVGQHLPQPGEVRDRGVGEDQRRVRVALGEPDGVLPERGDPAAGVDQHRQAALVRERDELADDRLVHPELLRARVQLDPGRAGVERPPRLGDRVVVRADAAEGDEPVRVVGGGADRDVVGGRVAVRLVHREEHGARVDGSERLEQLVRRLLVAVRVVLPDVGVRVVELQWARVLEDPVQPGPHGRLDVRHHRGSSL